MAYNKILELLATDADSLLQHKCTTFSKDLLHVPSPDFIDNIFINSNRNPQVLRNLAAIHNRNAAAGGGDGWMK